MKHHILAIGILMACTLAGLVLIGSFTEAQQTATNPAASNMLRIGSTDIPIIPSTADARPYFNQMMNSPGKQGFVFGSNPGTDFAQMYLLIETGDEDEGDVFIKIGNSYKRMDCETTFGTFSSYSLDYESYAGYSTVINFDMVVNEECQSNDSEGNYTAESFLPILLSGKNVIQSPTLSTPSPTTPPGATIAPSTTPTTTTVSASAPVLFEACDLGTGPVQRVQMNATRISNDKLPQGILTEDTAEYFLRPRNIIFTDAEGKDQYLLQVWNFSSNEFLAQSVIERGSTLRDSFFDLAKETALQAIDNAFWWDFVFGVDLDVGQPIDAATNAVQNYNSQFPSKSKEVNTKDVSLLPGFGKLTMGTRLCVFENGTPKSYWGRVYFEKNSPLAIPNVISSIGYSAKFISAQKGPVTVNIGISQLPILGTRDSITYANINASEDAPKTIFRFRLSDETLTELQNQNIFTPTTEGGIVGMTPAKIHEKFTITLRRKSDNYLVTANPISRMEGGLFNTDTPRYFTTAPVSEPAEGRPTKVDASRPIYAGEYVLILKAEGFKEYRQNITITPLMLSTEETQSVQDTRDVYKLTLKGLKLQRDCTATCTTFQTCLACLTSGIFVNYRTSESK